MVMMDERRSDVAALDLLDADEIVAAVIAGQAHVNQLVARARLQIAAAAEVLAERMAAGGRIVLLGAGTSGRLAVMEAAEVPGTYGIDPDRIVARVAGGGSGQLIGSDAAEDDTDLAREDMADLDLDPRDVLVAVAASGRTPYTVTAARLAIARGATVVTVTTMAGSPLAALASDTELAIEVPVGDEVVAGSTRLAAGTAQKMVLNTLTTTAMVRLGRVHEHYMVDVVAANDKLRHRITGVLAACTGVETKRAWAALERCDWNARAALVHLSTGLPPELAASRARAHRTVRAAIEATD